MNSIFDSKSGIEVLMLLIILIIGTVGFISFPHQPIYQVIIVALTGIAYIIWGAWHHLRHGQFYWQVMLEYLLISALVVVLTASLLL